MKRQRPSDLHVEETPPASDYTSYIAPVLVKMWREFTSQEIVAIRTTPPTAFGNAPKRRAVAREHIQTMPGHFPTYSEPPEEQRTRTWPTTPSPSPSRLGEDSSVQRQAQTSTAQGWVDWIVSRLSKSDQNAVAPSNETIARRQIEVTHTNALLAPPVSAKDDPAELHRSPRAGRKYQSINERLARMRKDEEAGQKSHTHSRESYATAATNRESTQPKTLTPRTEINNRQSFRRSHRSVFRESTNAARDSDVDGLLERLKRFTHDSTEERRFKEEYKLRIRRLANEKGVSGRAWERQEEERRILEEERLIEEAKVKERLQAQREEEQRAQEEFEAREAAQVAEEARKNLLIRPLESQWVTIVNNAMSTTNPQKVFSKGPDGSDITRYILGRILPQKNEGAVRASTNGKLGPDDWLNDECVDIWIAMLVARRLEQEGYVKGPGNTPSIASYLSAFWKTYKERGVKAINSWSRRKGISGKKLLGVEKVFFPINAGSHWALLVILPKSRMIEVFDSLSGSPSPYLKFARDWLAMELGEDYKPDEWHQSPVQSSQQQNSNDCGVFTCVNALASAKDKPPTAVISTDGMHDARNMMVAVLIHGGFTGDWEL